jgi:hypothetical protein
LLLWLAMLVKKHSKACLNWCEMVAKFFPVVWAVVVVVGGVVSFFEVVTVSA